MTNRKNCQYDDLLFAAFRIRRVEEEVVRLYPTDVIQSPVHLSIGQEAVAVGVCAALNGNDLLFPTYRSHSFYLAKGGPLGPFFAELMGKSGGIANGKGGSMHLADPQNGLMGASAIVGSTISHAVGAAIAENVLHGSNSRRIFVSVFGDGATEQGTFFESLNLAAVRGAPVLFVCEDNGLAVHTHPSDSKAFDLRMLVESFGISYTFLEEGYDPDLVFESSNQIVRQIRDTRTPHFLHVRTMRYKEHVGPGEDFDAGYRSEQEVLDWKQRDPLISQSQFSDEQVRAVDKEISQAVRFAMNSPEPDAEELLTDVY